MAGLGRCLALLSVGCLLHAGAAGAKPKFVHLDSVVGKVDLNVLVPLLGKGVVSLVESLDNGKLKQVTVVGLVEAPPDRVWGVLTDYAHYASIIPSLAEVEVLKREGQDVVLAVEVEVPGSNVEYTQRRRHQPKKRIDVWLEDDEGDITTGGWRWELVPHKNGTQTILVHTMYYDAMEASWILRQLSSSNPTTEHGLNVASGQVAVSAIKKKAEQ